MKQLTFLLASMLVIITINEISAQFGPNRHDGSGSGPSMSTVTPPSKNSPYGRRDPSTHMPNNPPIKSEHYDHDDDDKHKHTYDIPTKKEYDHHDNYDHYDKHEDKIPHKPVKKEKKCVGDHCDGKHDYIKKTPPPHTPEPHTPPPYTPPPYTPPPPPPPVIVDYDYTPPEDPPVIVDYDYTPPEDEGCIEDTGNVAPRMIKKAILSGDFIGISEVFSTYCGESNLARGFDFEGSLEALLQPTADRLNDPDIVSFKGLSYHSLHKHEYERLADIFLYALYGDDLTTNETTNGCVCKEYLVEHEVETLKNDDTHSHDIHNATPSVSIDKNADLASEWLINAGDSMSITNPIDEENKGCKWETTIMVKCEEGEILNERKLTAEEIAQKKEVLIEDFTNQQLMMSIVDNSYFADLIEGPIYTTPVVFTEPVIHTTPIVTYTVIDSDPHTGHRHLLDDVTDAEPSVTSSICYNTDPNAVCCDHLPEC